MKRVWTIYGIMLISSISAASPAFTDDLFQPGDKVTVRLDNESSQGEIVVATPVRNSQRMLVRLESIVSGHSGIIYIIGDTGGYRLATGEMISISK
jgi:hypothetical protein